jgi:hypothetical protein
VTRALYRLLATLLLLVGCLPTSLRAQETPAILGPAATNGQAAFDGIAGRAASLHRAMACSNEFEFVRGFALAKSFGKENAPEPEWKADLAQWPTKPPPPAATLGATARRIVAPIAAARSRERRDP